MERKGREVEVSLLGAFCLGLGVLIVGREVSGFDEDSMHLWYLADSQLSLEIEDGFNYFQLSN